LEKAAEIRGLETGMIRMGTLASISANWLPPLIHEFENRYPGIEFVIHQVGLYLSLRDHIPNGTCCQTALILSANRTIQFVQRRAGAFRRVQFAFMQLVSS
jgi:hypothetical protein